MSYNNKLEKKLVAVNGYIGLGLVGVSVIGLVLSLLFELKGVSNIDFVTLCAICMLFGYQLSMDRWGD